jgi:hypothetical protein
MKNLKEKIKKIIRTHGKQTITQLNRRLHIKRHNILQIVDVNCDFDYDWATDSYSINRKIATAPPLVIEDDDDEQSDSTLMQHLQLTVCEINRISKPHEILFYYRIGPNNIEHMTREQAGSIKLYAEPLKNEYHIERCLYAGDIPSCVKYLKLNKNRQDFFKNLKWSLSRPQCFHGDVNKGCDASGILFNKKTMKECEACKFYRGYPMGGKPSDKDVFRDCLNELENNLKIYTDMYFGTILLKAETLINLIKNCKNNDDNPLWSFVDELNEYFDKKSG